jgi:hypothetical protein
VPLNRWDITASQLQRNWRSGLFTTGYSLTLPWKQWPSSERMKVVVQFATLPNNRPFEAEKEVRIKVAPAAARGTAVPTPPVCLPVAPGAEGLPPPLDGPLLTPGAWLRERGDTNMVEAAKRPLDARQPVRLLDPEFRPED